MGRGRTACRRHCSTGRPRVDLRLPEHGAKGDLSGVDSERPSTIERAAKGTIRTS